tara:strand:+ start:95 stop:1732 length:1638 start_codon:yes stop_codon:yes gene_type:complete
MIKNGFLIAVLSLYFCFSGLIVASENQPMSAIDWLGEKINDPPDFYTFPREKNGLDEESNIEIQVNQLPGVSKNSIGIFGGIRLGLPVDIWSGEYETSIAYEIEAIPPSKLFRLNRFLKRVLLVEADPPIIDLKEKYSGKLFLKARISKLISMGALDDAEELLKSANPTRDTILLDLWAEVSFLTERLDDFCNTILKVHKSDMFPAYRVICLARSGDWNAAALTLATYSSMEKIDTDLEILLINYLDHEAELEIKNKELCLKDIPVLVYLCNFSGIKAYKNTLPIEFLYNNLSRSSSLRARIIASEELVRSGALDPNILFANYKIKQASTSGGVWARVRLVQELDKKLNHLDAPLPDLLEILLLTIQEFKESGLLTQFAHVYGKKIQKIKLNQFSFENQEKIIAFLLLSRIDLPYSRGDELLNSTVSTANKLSISSLGWSKNKKVFKTFQVDQSTLLNKVVLDASTGSFPKSRKSTDEILKLLSQNRTGIVLLKALGLIASGYQSDLLDLQIGLASLVRLGLLEEFKNIASEILILDYFNKTMER